MPILDQRPASQSAAEPAERAWKPAMLRGAIGRCPACGAGRMLHHYLKVHDHCPSCGEALYHQRAQDAPPYFTISIVAHIILPALLAVEVAWQPALWLHLVIWLPLTLILTLSLLPMVKGALIGLQWALRMHGFGGDHEDETAAFGLTPAP